MLSRFSSELNLTTGEATIRHGKPAQGADVVSLAFGRSRSEVIVARKNGVVVVLVDYVPSVTVSGFGAELAGAELVETGENEHSLLCVDVAGKAYLFGQDETGTIDVAGRAVSLQMEKPVDRFVVHKSLVAIGGKENRLRLWDVKLGQKVFEARNPPDDWLCLKVPMWISGLAFATQQAEGARVAIVTRHSDVQMFDSDPSFDRRPVWKVTVGSDPLNCVAFSNDNSKVFCGSSSGYVHILNAETGAVLGRMAPSCAGSVRDLVCAVDELVLAVGLDRFVYGFKQELRIMPHKVYAKQRLNRVLVLQEGKTATDGLEEAADDYEEDEAWFGLQEKEKDKESGSDEDNEQDDDEEEEEEEEAVEPEVKKRETVKAEQSKKRESAPVNKSLNKLKSRVAKKRRE